MSDIDRIQLELDALDLHLLIFRLEEAVEHLWLRKSGGGYSELEPIIAKLKLAEQEFDSKRPKGELETFISQLIVAPNSRSKRKPRSRRRTARRKPQ